MYAKRDAVVDADEYDRALGPAFDAVEQHLGPFEHPVDVHVWSGEDIDAASLAGLTDGELDRVPGIGPARVRAFHLRGGSNPFASSGVFLGSTDAGTAVHELVHARLSEQPGALPLWFEEGLASYLGDGALYGDRWTVDGLACWPLRELREERLSDEDLRRLLALTPQDSCDPRDNLLVHFVGWAIVFDLARENPDGSWRDWLARFQRGDGVAEARERIARTIDDRTHVDWLDRLDDPDPAVRFAAAKGTWKLRSTTVLDRLLDRLEDEEDPDVRVAIALNALLVAGEIRLPGRQWGRMGRLVFPSLRGASPPVATEARSLARLSSAMRGRGGDTDDALEGLARYWEE